MNEAFNKQTLVEKLSKLNSSQQSIESLSNWCICHRKKAKDIVDIWDQAFNSSSREKRVSLLYLANDILQNSRRKGSEFVNEFWKVLPVCLKNLYENGEDIGKKVVNRLAIFAHCRHSTLRFQIFCSIIQLLPMVAVALERIADLRKVDIWDERKVFGSRGRGLKDEILGDSSIPTTVSDNGKTANPIKLVRKDASSVRIKLAVGEMPEKIMTAYQSVFDESSSEDIALSKCKDVVQVLEKMDKDIDVACKQGSQQGSQLIDNLQEQENVLKQCIELLEVSKSTRIMLVAQLIEALKEQETKLELINNQLQIAHSRSEHAGGMRQRVILANGPSGFDRSPTLPIATSASDAAAVLEPNPPISITHHHPIQPVTSFASSLSSTEEDHKKAAAAVAAKLTASSSSAQVLTSILSSLAAEEAASMNNSSLSSQTLSDSLLVFPSEKRPRLEKPISMTDIGKISFFGQVQQHQQQTVPLAVPQTSAANIQQLSQSNQAPPTFTPPPPPLPPLPPPSLQPFAQTSGLTAVAPYSFHAGSLPLPPLLPHASVGFTRPGMPSPPPPPPPLQQQQQPPTPLQPTSMGFYPTPGIGFYGQPQTAPTAQRQ